MESLQAKGLTLRELYMHQLGRKINDYKASILGSPVHSNGSVDGSRVSVLAPNRTSYSSVRSYFANASSLRPPPSSYRRPRSAMTRQISAPPQSHPRQESPAMRSRVRRTSIRFFLQT